MWRLDGHDVYHGQGTFPWAVSRSLGHRLAAFKYTQRDNFLDDQAARNRAETARLGFPYRGLYHWQSPDASLDRQLAWFERFVGDLEPGEFIQLDQEDGGSQPTLTLTDCQRALDLWETRYPGRVCHYGYGGYANKIHYQLRQPWWRASATNVPPADTVVVLQYGQTPVAGVGLVDSNQIINEPVLRGLCGYGGNVIDRLANRLTQEVGYVEGRGNITKYAAELETLQRDYIDCWSGLKKNFNPGKREP